MWPAHAAVPTFIGPATTNTKPITIIITWDKFVTMHNTDGLSYTFTFPSGVEATQAFSAPLVSNNNPDTIFTIQILEPPPGRIEVNMAAMSGYIDQDGADNAAATTLVIFFDQTRPIPSFSMPSLTNTEPITVTINWNEDVTMNNLDGITLGGAGGTLELDSLSGASPGQSFTFEISDPNEGVVTITMAQDAYTDTAANTNNELVGQFTFDSVGAIPTIVTDTDVRVSPFLVKVRWNEPVDMSDISGITLTSGLVTNLLGASPGVEFDFQIANPKQGITILSIPAGSVYRDAAGNNNWGAAVNINFDKTKPTPTLIAPAKTKDVPIVVELRWTETVIMNGLAGITAAGAVIDQNSLTSTSTGKKYWFHIIDPQEGNIVVSLAANAGHVDVAGNENKEATPITINVDTAGATPSITGPRWTNEGRIQLNIVWDELVTMTSLFGVVVSGAAGAQLDQFSFKGNSPGALYRFDLLPFAEGDIFVTVNAGGGHVDVVGNNNKASVAPAYVMTYDVTRPVPTFTVPRYTQTIPVRAVLDWSEITSFALFSGVKVDGGPSLLRLSTLAGTSPGTHFEFDIDNLIEAEYEIYIQDQGGYKDLALNANVPSVRAKFRYDITPPIATAQWDRPIYELGSRATLTLRFVEDLQGSPFKPKGTVFGNGVVSVTLADPRTVIAVYDFHDDDPVGDIEFHLEQADLTGNVAKHNSSTVDFSPNFGGITSVPGINSKFDSVLPYVLAWSHPWGSGKDVWVNFTFSEPVQDVPASGVVLTTDYHAGPHVSANQTGRGNERIGWFRVGPAEFRLAIDPTGVDFNVTFLTGAIVDVAGNPTIVSSRHAVYYATAVLTPPTVYLGEDIGVNERASYGVALATQPHSDVTITVTPVWWDLVVTSANKLVFSPATWNVPQTVDLRALDDNYDDDLHVIDVNHTASSADTYFDLKNLVIMPALTDDNDMSDFVIKAGTNRHTLVENGANSRSETAEYAVRITTRPYYEVDIVPYVVSIQSCASNASAVVFDPPVVKYRNVDNFRFWRGIRVRLLDNAASCGLLPTAVSASIVVGHRGVSQDAKYNGLTGVDALVHITVMEDDNAQLLVDPAEVLVDEKHNNTAGVYHLSLSTAPFADVTVSVVPEAANQSRAEPTRLVFTTADWNVKQPVHVFALADEVDEGGGTHKTAMLHNLTSVDELYNVGSAAPKVSVVIVDSADHGVAVDISPAPRMVSARLLDDAHAVRVTFDVDTDRAGMPLGRATGLELCGNRLLGRLSLLAFGGTDADPGRGPFCYWETSHSFVAELVVATVRDQLNDGFGYPARGGEPVTLRPHSIRRTPVSLRSATGTVALLPRIRPPRVVDARYRPGGGIIDMTFTSDSSQVIGDPKRSGDLRRGDCSHLFHNSSFLGKGNICQWVTARLLRITLGVGASQLPFTDANLTCVPGTTLTLRAHTEKEDPARVTGVRVAPYGVLVSSQCVATQPPVNPPAPVAAISAPATIGVCDDLVLDAGPSSGAAGGELKHSWQVFPTNAAAKAAVANLTAAMDGQWTKRIVFLPAHSLAPAGTYRFTLVVTNIFAVDSPVASHNVTKRVITVPTAVLQGAPVRTVRRSQRVQLVVSARAPRCAGAAAFDTTSLRYSWSVVSVSATQRLSGGGRWVPDPSVTVKKGDPPVLIQTVPEPGLASGYEVVPLSLQHHKVAAVAAKDPRVLRLPSGFLQVGHVYKLRATVQDTNSSSYVDAVVEVVPDVIKARIAGGDRTIGTNETIRVDAASESVDYDGLATSFQFTWNCTVQSGVPWMQPAAAPGAGPKCFDARNNNSLNVHQYAVGSAGTLRFPENVLMRGSPANPVVLRFSVDVSKGIANEKVPAQLRTARATAVITLIDRRVPLVSFPSLFERRDKVNAWERNKLAANIKSFGGNLRLAWSIVVDESNKKRDHNIFDSPLNRPTLSIRPYKLIPGDLYRFRLDAVDDEGAAFAEVDLVVNRPPSGGYVDCSPRTGDEATTKFLLSALRWADDPEDLPLTYALGFTVVEPMTPDGRAMGTRENLEHRVSDFREQAFATTIMPAGKGGAPSAAVRVWTYVRDDLGATTLSDVDATGNVVYATVRKQTLGAQAKTAFLRATLAPSGAVGSAVVDVDPDEVMSSLTTVLNVANDEGNTCQQRGCSGHGTCVQGACVCDRVTGYSGTFCAIKPDPVDGAYSEWGAWSGCSLLCGGGKQTRHRTCTNPAAQYGGRPCTTVRLGPTSQTRTCNNFKCGSATVHGGYAPWTEWSECGAPCMLDGPFGQMPGTRTRSRTCTNPSPTPDGTGCVAGGLGAPTESQPCHRQCDYPIKMCPGMIEKAAGSVSSASSSAVNATLPTQPEPHSQRSEAAMVALLQNHTVYDYLPRDWQPCSGHGVCTTGRVVPCRVDNPSCHAVCLCDVGYGGRGCEYTTGQFNEFSTWRTDALNTFVTTLSDTDITPDKVEQAARVLLDLSAVPEELSHDSRQLAIKTARWLVEAGEAYENITVEIPILPATAKKLMLTAGDVLVHVDRNATVYRERFMELRNVTGFVPVTKNTTNLTAIALRIKAEAEAAELERAIAAQRAQEAANGRRLGGGRIDRSSLHAARREVLMRRMRLSAALHERRLQAVAAGADVADTPYEIAQAEAVAAAEHAQALAEDVRWTVRRIAHRLLRTTVSGGDPLHVETPTVTISAQRENLEVFNQSVLPSRGSSLRVLHKADFAMSASQSARDREVAAVAIEWSINPHPASYIGQALDPDSTVVSFYIADPDSGEEITVKGTWQTPVVLRLRMPLYIDPEDAVCTYWDDRGDDGTHPRLTEGGNYDSRLMYFLNPLVEVHDNVPYAVCATKHMTDFTISFGDTAQRQNYVPPIPDVGIVNRILDRSNGIVIAMLVLITLGFIVAYFYSEHHDEDRKEKVTPQFEENYLWFGKPEVKAPPLPPPPIPDKVLVDVDEELVKNKRKKKKLAKLKKEQEQKEAEERAAAEAAKAAEDGQKDDIGGTVSGRERLIRNNKFLMWLCRIPWVVKTVIIYRDFRWQIYRWHSFAGIIRADTEALFMVSREQRILTLLCQFLTCMALSAWAITADPDLIVERRRNLTLLLGVLFSVTMIPAQKFFPRVFRRVNLLRSRTLRLAERTPTGTFIERRGCCRKLFDCFIRCAWTPPSRRKEVMPLSAVKLRKPAIALEDVPEDIKDDEMLHHRIMEAREEAERIRREELRRRREAREAEIERIKEKRRAGEVDSDDEGEEMDAEEAAAYAARVKAVAKGTTLAKRSKAEKAAAVKLLHRDDDGSDQLLMWKRAGALGSYKVQHRDDEFMAKRDAWKSMNEMLFTGDEFNPDWKETALERIVEEVDEEARKLEDDIKSKGGSEAQAKQAADKHKALGMSKAIALIGASNRMHKKKSSRRNVASAARQVMAAGQPPGRATRVGSATSHASRDSRSSSKEVEAQASQLELAVRAAQADAGVLRGGTEDDAAAAAKPKALLALLDEAETAPAAASPHASPSRVGLQVADAKESPRGVGASPVDALVRSASPTDERGGHDAKEGVSATAGSTLSLRMGSLLPGSMHIAHEDGDAQHGATVVASKSPPALHAVAPKLAPGIADELAASASADSPADEGVRAADAVDGSGSVAGSRGSRRSKKKSKRDLSSKVKPGRSRVDSGAGSRTGPESETEVTMNALAQAGDGDGDAAGAGEAGLSAGSMSLSTGGSPRDAAGSSIVGESKEFPEGAGASRGLKRSRFSVAKLLGVRHVGTHRVRKLRRHYGILVRRQHSARWNEKLLWFEPTMALVQIWTGFVTGLVAAVMHWHYDDELAAIQLGISFVGVLGPSALGYYFLVRNANLGCRCLVLTMLSVVLEAASWLYAMWFDVKNWRDYAMIIIGAQVVAVVVLFLTAAVHLADFKHQRYMQRTYTLARRLFDPGELDVMEVNDLHKYKSAVARMQRTVRMHQGKTRFVRKQEFNKWLARKTERLALQVMANAAAVFYIVLGFYTTLIYGIKLNDEQRNSWLVINTLAILTDGLFNQPVMIGLNVVIKKTYNAVCTLWRHRKGRLKGTRTGLDDGLGTEHKEVLAASAFE